MGLLATGAALLSIVSNVLHAVFIPVQAKITFSDSGIAEGNTLYIIDNKEVIGRKTNCRIWHPNCL
jgi:hypothetical protein